MMLQDALRSGSPRLRAWAASRARLPGVVLAPREAREANAARTRMGRLLRVERARRIAAQDFLAPVVAVDEALLPMAPARVWPRRLGLAAAVLALIAAGVLIWQLTHPPVPAEVVEPPPPAEDGGALRAAAAPEVRGAGITSPFFRPATPAPVAVAPAPEPVAPAPAPAPVTRPGNATVPGGVGTGTAPRVSTPAPVPATAAPAPGFTFNNPPALAAGFRRLEGVVTDERLQPLSGVCVVIGPRPCQAIEPHTDSNGKWYVDLPLGAGGLNWDFRFERSGYQQFTYRVRPDTLPAELAFVKLTQPVF